MTSERWAQVRALFARASDLPIDERESFLSHECGDDVELLAEVRSLLSAMTGDASGSPAGAMPTVDLERTAGAAAGCAATDQPPRHEPVDRPGALAPGSRVGGFTIVSLISSGGMGAVYRAEQQRPHRTVALKLIRPGLLSPSLLRRFEFEADVLARLEHPGIARIYEAGTADAGTGPQPYFAMELVEGKPLDKYLASAAPPLKPRNRVELFHAICAAVQHAHSRGIVHRDLKPDNILVTADGRPKILDFGVARAVGSDEQLKTTLHTESGQIVGTVPYMAPEQVRGEVDALDTATDVYALGVIGYEVLAGRMPYAVKQKPLLEAARVICEEEPSRLSSIDRSLRGDVETIVQKALEKDKTRRYGSAGDLAADVKRFLDYEPITARPPGTWYQFTRFAKRNRGLVGGLAATLALLVVGVTISTWQAIRATRAEHRAAAAAARATVESAKQSAVNTFLNEMLASANPRGLTASNRDRGREVTLVQMLDRAAERLDAGSLKDQPEVEAAVRATLAETYDGLRQFGAAEPHARRALELLRARYPEGSTDLAKALNNVATTLQGMGRFADADPLLIEAEAMQRQVAAEDAAGLASLLNNRGYGASKLGRLDEADSLYAQALVLRRRALGEKHLDVVLVMANLAELRSSQGKVDEAEALQRQVLALRRELLGPSHPDIAISLNNLGGLLHSRGKLVDAEPLLREALAMRIELLGMRNPDVASSINNLAGLMQARDQFEEAERLYRQALEIRRELSGPKGRDVGDSLNNLAALARRRGDMAGAERAFREALLVRREAMGPDHLDVAQTSYNLAHTLVSLKRYDDAEPFARDSLRIRAMVYPPGHHFTANSLVQLGEILTTLGRYEEAEPLLLDAQRAMLASSAALNRRKRDSLSALVTLYERWGRAQNARQWQARLKDFESQPVNVPGKGRQTAAPGLSPSTSTGITSQPSSGPS